MEPSFLQRLSIEINFFGAVDRLAASGLQLTELSESLNEKGDD